jgi:hypothetical protein
VPKLQLISGSLRAISDGVDNGLPAKTPEPLPDWTADQDLLQWLDRFSDLGSA